MKKTEYTLSILPFIPWSVYQVAEKKGFWEELGIHVRVKNYANDQEYIDAVTEIRDDFFPLPLSSLVEFRNAGVNLNLLGALKWSNGHKQIIARKHLVNQDISGQKIGIYMDEIATRFMAASFLRTFNKSLSDVDLVFMSEAELADAFIRNELNIILVFRNDKERICREGDGRIVFTTADYSDPFGIAVHEDRLGQIPDEDISKLLKGRIKAEQWLKQEENRPAFADLVNQVTFSDYPDMTADTVIARYEEMKHPDYKTLLTYNQKEMPTVFDLTRQTMKNENIINQKALADFSFENIVKNRILIELLKNCPDDGFF